MKRLIVILIFVASLATAQTPQTPQMFRDWQAVGSYVPILAAPSGLLYPMWNNAAMTASNAPSPNVVSESSRYNDSYAGWYAFDRMSSGVTRWQTTAMPAWLIYDSGTGNSNVCCSLGFYNYVNNGPKVFTFAGSNDGSSYVTNMTATNADVLWRYYDLPIVNFYRFYRLDFISSWGGQTLLGQCFLSSGKILNTLTMTNNVTTPYTASASSVYQTYNPYLAFDNNPADASGWYATGTSAEWIKLDFGSNVVSDGFDIRCNPHSLAYSLAGSIDDVTYTSISTGMLTVANSYVAAVTNGNTTAYRYYRLTLDGSLTRTQVQDLYFKKYR